MFKDFTLTELKAMRKELDEGISTGAETVKFADRTISLRPTPELRQISSDLDARISELEGGHKLRRIYINSEKGFRL